MKELYMKKNGGNFMTEIKRDGNDVVVVSDKKEVFRRTKTKQTVAIANDIYMFYKYGKNNIEKAI